MSALKAFVGGRLFGRRYGIGVPRVLALHGWGRSSLDFDGVLEGLDAIALDLPGFGATPPPKAGMGAAQYSELVRSIIGEFEEPPVIVGHSFGGRVALHLENLGLVLCGVPLIRNPSSGRLSLGYRIIRRAHRVGLVSDVTMEKVRRNRGSADYRAATGVMRDVLVKVVNESYEKELGDLTGPVRLVWGVDDIQVPVEVARTALGLLEANGVDVRLDEIEEAGHDLPLTNPQTIRSAVEEFL